MNYDKIKRFIDENNYDKAMDEIDLLISQNADDDEAYYLKGKVYQRQQKLDNAIIAYNKAIELNKDSKAVTVLEMLYGILGSLNNEIIET
ncbi:MAG: tetratricopeptide repeat protein [Prevotellaceae bacterium]|jgi:Flp pilus assembly protein TadD|nr:tetratricopeptide repeat protein [Prevotellaceae bacterium]